MGKWDSDSAWVAIKRFLVQVLTMPDCRYIFPGFNCSEEAYVLGVVQNKMDYSIYSIKMGQRHSSVVER